MADVLDPASMLEAAQKAVGDGDYLEAERLLREAASRQEATLGASHPDLAITLNNLAFVCERTNQFDEAERGYRRAHAIAVASLSPGHPFIATSLGNLLDFCASRGIPIWTPPARSNDETPLSDFAEEQADDSGAEPSEVPVTPDVRHEPASVPNRLTSRMIAVVALGVAIIITVMFTRQGQGTTDTPGSVPEARPESVPSAPPPVSRTETIPVAPREPDPVAPREPEPPVTREQRPATTTPVTVLNAQLCSALERKGSPDWQCTSVNGDTPPGTYIFYTRLLTNADTTVEHRWYRNERVHHVRQLRVTASPVSGYRTFSTNTVSAERAGDWKVELRAADGSLLQEEHFVVR